LAFTYFFRDMQSLNTATDFVVPTVEGRQKIRIWDAGCAMGPEPYTLAMLFAEKMGQFAFRNLHIDATDIDTSNLFREIIAKGVYPENQIKRIPPVLFNKYFEPDVQPGYFKIINKIRSRVFFQRHDLLTFQPIDNNYNLIVCKNVLLHFKQEERIKVIKMFYDVLTDGGLFVTEQTQKMPGELSHLFEQVIGNVQLFRKLGNKNKNENY